jgi:hypothetical protein
MNIAKRPAPPNPLLRLFAKLEHRTAAEADSRRFPFVCSTDVRDRNGRIVAQDWELEAYLKNPIVLWNHGLGGSSFGEGDVPVDEYFPIGRAENVRVEAGRLLADIVIASVFANPLAERIYQALKERILNAVSVGWDPSQRSYETRDGEEVLVLSGNRLLEISVVPLPANPDAVRASFAASARGFTSHMAPRGETSLAEWASRLGLGRNATEGAVIERAKGLAAFGETVLSVTGSPTHEQAGRDLGQMFDRAQKSKALEMAREEEARFSRGQRLAAILKAGRDAGKLTPANEPGYLRALCGDEKGTNADPDALASLVAALPQVMNLAFAATAPDLTDADIFLGRPTAREASRAPKLGTTPEALAAERLRMARERAGTTDETDED